jgi:hypothetical protein
MAQIARASKAARAPRSENNMNAARRPAGHRRHRGYSRFTDWRAE